MKKVNVYHLILTALFIAIIVVLGLTPIGLIRLGFCNATTLCIPVLIGTVILGLKKGLVLGAAFGAVSAYGAFGTAPSALIEPLVAASPVLALLICFVPRLLVPVTASGAYHLVKKGKAAPYVIAVLITALCTFAAINSFDTIETKIAGMLFSGEGEAPVTALASGIAMAVTVGIPAIWVIVFSVIIYLYRVKSKRALDVPMAAAVGSLTNTVCYLGMIYFAYRLLGLDASAILGMLIGFGMFVGMIEAIIASVISSPVATALTRVKSNTTGR